MSAKHAVPFTELVARIERDPTRTDSLVGLLPVLEHEYLEAQAFANVEALRLPEVVTFALREGSAYWAGLALHWLEAGFPNSGYFKEDLLFVSQRSALEQSVRHRAFALHKKTA